MDFLKPHPLGLDDPPDSGVYCAQCMHFKQHALGNKTGTCFGQEVPDGTIPYACPHYMNHLQIISLLVFLQNGISIYNRAIVPNAGKQIDPQLLSSFLQAINMFGEELTQEQVSQIQFQKMNIYVCRNDKAYGAMLVKGDVNDRLKTVFTSFLKRVEENFPDYFCQDYNGVCLPTEEVDRLGFACIKEYREDYEVKELHPIPKEVIENGSKLKVAPLLEKDT